MADRVAIFIDGSNLYHALRENVQRTDLNFTEFVHKLVGDDRRLLRTYYYNVLQDPGRNPDGAREQAEFLNILKGAPFLEVRLGTTKRSEGGMVEKGVDVTLATDLVQYAWDNIYDVAILVSGDGDFAYACQAVKNRGKHLEVAYFESNASRDLLELADVRHPMDKAYFQDLWWGRSRNLRRRRRPSRGSGGGGGPAGGEQTASAPQEN